MNGIDKRRTTNALAGRPAGGGILIVISQRNRTA